MTSTTDTAGHLDVAEISDLTEGLLPPDRSTDVRLHLDGCEPCADVYASLREIQGLLGSMPGPERMPADVAARIDAALAAEASHWLPPARTPPVMFHVKHRLPVISSRAAPRVPSPISLPTAPRAVRVRRPGRAARTPRGRRRGRFVLGAVLTAAVLGAGSLVLTSLADNGDETAAHGTPTPSAETFSGDSVQHQARALLTTKKGLQRGSEKPRQNTGDGGRTRPARPRGRTPWSDGGSGPRLRPASAPPEHGRPGRQDRHVRGEVRLPRRRGRCPGRQAGHRLRGRRGLRPPAARFGRHGSAEAVRRASLSRWNTPSVAPGHAARTHRECGPRRIRWVG